MVLVDVAEVEAHSLQFVALGGQEVVGGALRGGHLFCVGGLVTRGGCVWPPPSACICWCTRSWAACG